APMARGPHRRLGPRNADRGAVVVRADPGVALRLRTGSSDLLSMASRSGGAHRGGANLVSADPGGPRRDRAHLRLSDPLARCLGLVGPDDGVACADPRLRAIPVALAPGRTTRVKRRRRVVRPVPDGAVHPNWRVGGPLVL